MEPVSRKTRKKLRVKKYRDACGRGLIVSERVNSSCPLGKIFGFVLGRVGRVRKSRASPGREALSLISKSTSEFLKIK